MPGISTPSPPPEAGPSQPKPTSSHFHTLDREKAFSHPSSISSKYSATQALVAPHIDSFDALFEGAPTGKNGQIELDSGLLNIAVADLLPKVVFDGKTPGTGNRLECESHSFERNYKILRFDF